MRPVQIVEAVLFASDAPLRTEEIARADSALDEDVVEEALQELKREYDDGERAFEVREVAGGYQVLTRPEFAPYLERFDTVPRPSRLSGPALETLAIIAYRQPIGRIEVEYIRGVGSTGVIRTLQDRGLIEVVGRAEGLGRPLLYGTGARFLEHFGFRSLEDLPRPEELPIVLRERAPLGPDEPEDAESPLAAEEPAAGTTEGAVEPAAPAGESATVEEEAITAPAVAPAATIDLSLARDVEVGALPSPPLSPDNGSAELLERGGVGLPMAAENGPGGAQEEGEHANEGPPGEAGTGPETPYG